MFTQLNPSIPMDTPKGRGLALAVIDYGQEHNLLWVVTLNTSGEIWCVPNSHVRVPPNWSAERQPE
jgi:hypothetical protein